jgi:F420-non-reducing hydrogenase iron-sulfur subunit
MTKAVFKPKIVGFLCNWCSYAGADLAGVSRIQYPPTLRIVRVMCSGRVDPVFILEAFRSGADGVLVAGCHPGDCHYLSGNYKAQRRILMLKKVLEQLGLEPERLRLEWVSASEGDRFATIVKDMTEEITKLGPSPLSVGGHFNVKK